MKLSVTEIETLRRDPYSIYARHVLALQPLDHARRGGGRARGRHAVARDHRRVHGAASSGDLPVMRASNCRRSRAKSSRRCSTTPTTARSSGRASTRACRAGSNGNATAARRGAQRGRTLRQAADHARRRRDLHARRARRPHRPSRFRRVRHPRLQDRARAERQRDQGRLRAAIAARSRDDAATAPSPTLGDLQVRDAMHIKIGGDRRIEPRSIARNGSIRDIADDAYAGLIESAQPLSRSRDALSRRGPIRNSPAAFPTTTISRA